MEAFISIPTSSVWLIARLQIPSNRVERQRPLQPLYRRSGATLSISKSAARG
jgi:hypothetical protein